MVKNLVIALISFELCLVSTGVLANKPKEIKAAEMALIPQYCPDTMGFGYGDAYYNTSPRAGQWVAIYGKDFWNLHHYCWGRINHLRAKRHNISKLERRSLLLSVLDDYQYVLDRAKPDFFLLPEILTYVGDAELMLSRVHRAQEAFARARELNPTYWPAYSHWIEYLISKGLHAEARRLTREGLEHAPNATVLQQQYRLLGGDPAEITPRPKPTESADSGNAIKDLSEQTASDKH